MAAIAIGGVLGFAVSTVANAQAADADSNSLAGQIDWELDNVRYWLSVATGELDPCEGQQTCIADTDFSNIVSGMSTRCEREDPASLRTLPAFDSARHGDQTSRLAAACDGLTTAGAALGSATDSPEWRSAVADALAVGGGPLEVR